MKLSRLSRRMLRVCLVWTAVISGCLFLFSCDWFDSDGISEAAKRFETEEIIIITSAQGDTLYTGPRYNRAFQSVVQEIIKGINPTDIYDEGYFRLDSTNTDHFYEDIGKYPQYVFGWADWFFRFVADEAGNLIYPRWELDGPVDNPNTHWIGNYPQWGSDMNTIIAPGSPEASQMREVFNDLSD